MDNKEVYRRGRLLCDHYGLKDWSVVVDERPKYRRLGQCRMDTKQIGVSSFFLGGLFVVASLLGQTPPVGRLDEVLLHEIAHALTPYIGHRLPWKRKYAEVLWSHFQPDTVRDFLKSCRYCCVRVDELFDHARRHAGRRRRTDALLVDEATPG